jgi:hypothetical protein
VTARLKRWSRAIRRAKDCEESDGLRGERWTEMRAMDWEESDGLGDEAGCFFFSGGGGCRMILGTNTQGNGKVLVMFVCLLCSSRVYTESRSPSLLSFSSQQSNYIILMFSLAMAVCPSSSYPSLSLYAVPKYRPPPCSPRTIQRVSPGDADRKSGDGNRQKSKTLRTSKFTRINCSSQVPRPARHAKCLR